MIGSETQAREYVGKFTSNEGLNRLDRLAAALSAENESQNLVSKSSLEHVWVRHFADSAQLLEHVPRETHGPWLDLGSGAGFPGLVLATLRPDTEVILIESRKLRIDWLSTMKAELGLTNCVIEGQKLQNVEACEAGIISARAFAPLAKLLRLSARFSTARTHWVLPKGRSAAQEVQELPKSERQMFHVEQSMTDADAGIVVGKGKVREKA